VRATWGSEAGPADLERVTDAILAGKLTVPIAAAFPIEQIRDAVALQARRHVHGKIVARCDHGLNTVAAGERARPSTCPGTRAGLPARSLAKV
jgi:hypothetical protein